MSLTRELPSVAWYASYKGATVNVNAKDNWGAKVEAAMALGVASSRTRHIHVKKVSDE